MSWAVCVYACVYICTHTSTKTYTCMFNTQCVFIPINTLTQSRFIVVVFRSVSAPLFSALFIWLSLLYRDLIQIWGEHKMQQNWIVLGKREVNFQREKRFKHDSSKHSKLLLVKIHASDHRKPVDAVIQLCSPPRHYPCGFLKVRRNCLFFQN